MFFCSSSYSLAARIYEKECTGMPRCAAAVVSAGAPAKEYTYSQSMMHRRLTTAGIEVGPHYHQLVAENTPSGISGYVIPKITNRWVRPIARPAQ